jgi:hypothetical protein
MPDLCRHCSLYRANRPRKLCRRCHDDHAIRARYPSCYGCGSRGVTGGSNVELPVAEVPTRELPGSAAKVEVMRERASAGRAVFHPGDRRRE